VWTQQQHSELSTQLAATPGDLSLSKSVLIMI
jgi:hypothetical protein